MHRSGRAVLTMIAVIGALALAGGCGSAAQSASNAPTTTAPERKITVAGDSISIGLGASLRKQAGDGAVVKVIGEEGSGLARPQKFDWPGRLAQLSREFPPSVLVLSLSSNDAQDLTDANGKIVASFANPAAWDAEYSTRLAASFDAFAGRATTVVWVGHVRTTEDRVAATNRRVQKLATVVAATRPWVVVSDLAALLGVGEQRADRCLEADGLHLSVACLDEAAGALQPQIAPLRR